MLSIQKPALLCRAPDPKRPSTEEAGLAPPKDASIVNSSITSTPATTNPGKLTPEPRATTPAQNDCKPKIHKKTGGTMPCPAPE